MDETEVLEEMRQAVGADKLAGDPTGWASGSGRDSLILILPLDVQSPTMATTRLVLRAVSRTPDRDISASLIVTLSGRDFRAWRMDWRPIHPHVNKYGPSKWRGMSVETGIHDFACNAKLGLKRMQAQDLPICVPVDPEPHDFDAFVRFVCDRLKITITEKVLSPPWSPSFF
jgi:hypothetical protein